MTKRKNWLAQIYTIERAGYAAYQAGQPSTDNPYLVGMRKGVQRQRWQAWRRGHELAARHAAETREELNPEHYLE